MAGAVIPEFDLIRMEEYEFSVIVFKNRQYPMKGLIGEGSFGQVYRAENPSAKKQVAFKMIDVGDNDNEVPRLFVLREIQLQNQASTMDRNKGRQFITEILAHRDEDQFMYILMEYAAHGDAFRNLKRISEDSLLLRTLFQQVVLGVKYLHTCKIIHRDLKPDNLYLTAPDKLKIGDFGHSLYLSELNVLVPLEYGSDVYGAPEVHNGEEYKGVYPPLDVWAVGMILLNFSEGNNFFWSEATQQDVKYRQWITRGSFYRELKSKMTSNVFDLACRILVEDVSRRPTIFELEEQPFFTNRILRK